MGCNFILKSLLFEKTLLENENVCSIAARGGDPGGYSSIYRLYGGGSAEQGKEFEFISNIFQKLLSFIVLSNVSGHYLPSKHCRQDDILFKPELPAINIFCHKQGIQI